MYWFIYFPNEPEHPLQEQIIDFGTLMDIVTGKSSSRLHQMSKIHKMLLRYSERKAARFLKRFPQVYWAPEEKFNNLNLQYYYTQGVLPMDDKSSTYIAWWSISHQKRVVLIRDMDTSDNKRKLLQPGSAFTLYQDGSAGFIDQNFNLTAPSSSAQTKPDNFHFKEIVRVNNQLRSTFQKEYNWQQDALPHQVEWITVVLASFLKPGARLRPISKTQYVFLLNDLEVGLLFLQEYKIYITFWSIKGQIPVIFDQPISTHDVMN